MQFLLHNVASLHPVPIEETQMRCSQVDSQTHVEVPHTLQSELACTEPLGTMRGTYESASSYPNDAAVVATHSQGPQGRVAIHEQDNDEKHDDQARLKSSYDGTENVNVRPAGEKCGGDDDEASSGVAKRARTTLEKEIVPQSQFTQPNPTFADGNVLSKPLGNSAMMALMNAASMAVGSEGSVDSEGQHNSQHLDIAGAGLAASSISTGAHGPPLLLEQSGYAAGWNGRARRRASSHGSSSSTHSARGSRDHDRGNRDDADEESGDDNDNDSEASVRGGQLGVDSSRDEFMRTTSFVRKLYDIFDNSEFNPSLVHWSEDGKSIYFTSEQSVETRVLPVYFKHGNFRSMCRQLNSYCFQKIFNSEGTIEFRHPLFQRGREDLLHQIIRKDARKPTHLQPPPSHLPTHLPPGRGGPGAPSAVAVQRDRLRMVHLQREGFGFSSSSSSSSGPANSNNINTNNINANGNSNSDFASHLMIPPGLILPRPEASPKLGSSLGSPGSNSGFGEQEDRLRRENSYLAAELRGKEAEIANVTSVAASRQDQLEVCYQQQQVLVRERDQAAEACQQLQRQAAALTRELNQARQERDLAMLQSSMAASLHAQPHNSMQPPLLHRPAMPQQPPPQPPQLQYAPPNVPHVLSHQHAPSLVHGLPQAPQPHQQQHVQQSSPQHVLGYHHGPSSSQGLPQQQQSTHNFVAPPGQLSVHAPSFASISGVPYLDHHQAFPPHQFTGQGMMYSSSGSGGGGGGPEKAVANMVQSDTDSNTRAAGAERRDGPEPTRSTMAL